VTSDPGYSGLDAADVSVTNRDDDRAGVSVSAASGPTSEAGGTATFTVALTSQPTADVTIPVRSSDPSEETISVASVTFTPAKWNVAQTVTVTGVYDFVVDGEVAYTVVLGRATSADPNYDGLKPADVALTNRDNDTAGVAVSAASGPTTEAG